MGACRLRTQPPQHLLLGVDLRFRDGSCSVVGSAHPRWPVGRHPDNDEKKLAVETPLRKDISIFFGGSVVAFGLIAALIQFQANLEREARQQRATRAQMQANTERDQRQQRATLASENIKLFDKAVGLLNSKSMTPQLGGIYAFSELIKQEGFYWPAVAQLTAFLRQKLLPVGAKVGPDTIRNRFEIFSALHVLSERDKVSWEGRTMEPIPLDLSGLNLSELKFSDLRLWGSSLRYTDLSGAIIPGALLEDADLYCANMEGASFAEQQSP